MTEQRVLDAGTGKMVNANWHDYKIPTAMDVPAELTCRSHRPARHGVQLDGHQGARRAGPDSGARRPSPTRSTTPPAYGPRGAHHAGAGSDQPAEPGREAGVSHAARNSLISRRHRSRKRWRRRRVRERAFSRAARTCWGACATASSPRRPWSASTGIAELKGIGPRAGGGLRIGALTTLTRDRRRTSRCAETYPRAGAKRRRSVASPQLRNQGTIGGNLCQRPRCWYFRGDFHCRRKGGDTCFAEAGENQYPRHSGVGPVLHGASVGHRAGAGGAGRAG